MAEGKKILLVEDEEMLANMYQVKFQNDGFQLIKAGNGEEGLVLAEKEKPDMILLDVIMPKMDGFTVLKRLKDNPSTKNIPVLLLTNLGQDEDVKKGNELGAVGYLVKANITPSEVVAKVKEVMKL
ncbi:MAG: response regulator [Candidatus Komeilibacteria bacterium]